MEKSLPRLKKHYQEIIPILLSEFGGKNQLAAPRLEKVIINQGIKEATSDKVVLDKAISELSQVTGQKPQVRRAKKSIAAFKLVKGEPIGLRVTLRGFRMYHFLDRLFNIVLPRVRDFRGASFKAFDGRGNYTLGIRELVVFPEIDLAKVDKIRGLEITIVTNTQSDEKAKRLLELLGMPFKKI